MLTHVMNVEVNEAVHSEEKLEDLVQKFWKIDSVVHSENSESDTIIEKFKQEIKFDGSNYSVSLPWKQELDTIPDNYMLCKRRLYGQLKRLKKTPELLKQYDGAIKDLEADGVIENVRGTHEVGLVHYLPHREVIRDDKDTTKFRIVHDGGAKTKNGVSLNDCLEKGPCMLPKIFDILVRFRCFTYAVVSDIKAAFLNIRVDEKDRDFLRFLWVADINDENPELVAKRFTSVLFGLNSSPFLLNMTISTHMNKFLDTDEEVVVAFLRDIYMDDDLSGAQTFEKAFNLYIRSKELMKQGGFQLRKWTTNDQKLREKIRRSEQEVFGETDSMKDEDEIKILGVTWKPKEDVTIFVRKNRFKGFGERRNNY